MAAIDIEDRIMDLERTTAVHTAQISNIDRGFERLSESLDGLTDTMTAFTQGCSSEQGKISTEIKWLERGALFILACLLTSVVENVI